MKRFFYLLTLFFLSYSIHAQNKLWSIEDCMQHATKNNISVKQSELNIESAATQAAIAKGDRYPTLSASGSQNWSFGSGIGVDGSRVSNDRRSSNFGLSANMLLFNGFRVTNTYKQSLLGLESSKLELQRMKNDMSLNIANFYLNILLAKENVNLAQNQLEITRSQYKRMKELVSSGVNPKADLLEIEATLASNEESLVTAENNVDLAKLSLTQLLQISYIGFDIVSVDLEIDNPTLILDNPTIIYDKALSYRPEIKIAEINNQSADYDITIAKSAYMPTVSFSAGSNTTYQHIQGLDDFISFEDQFFDLNIGHFIGLSINIPIFNGFKTKESVKRAKIARENSDYALEQQKLTLKENVVRAFIDAKTTLKQYDAAKSSLLSQEEAFRVAQERFNLGVLTSFDFDQVRNRMLNAEINLLNAKYNYIFKTKVLEFYSSNIITLE